jgi:hypothetical protein
MGFAQSKVITCFYSTYAQNVYSPLGSSVVSSPLLKEQHIEVQWSITTLGRTAFETLDCQKNSQLSRNSEFCSRNQSFFVWLPQRKMIKQIGNFELKNGQKVRVLANTETAEYFYYTDHRRPETKVCLPEDEKLRVLALIEQKEDAMCIVNTDTMTTDEAVEKSLQFVIRASGRDHIALEMADSNCDWVEFRKIFFLHRKHFAHHIVVTRDAGMDWNCLDENKIDHRNLPWFTDFLHCFLEEALRDAEIPAPVMKVTKSEYVDKCIRFNALVEKSGADTSKFDRNLPWVQKFDHLVSVAENALKKADEAEAVAKAAEEELIQEEEAEAEVRSRSNSQSSRGSRNGDNTEEIPEHLRSFLKTIDPYPPTYKDTAGRTHKPVALQKKWEEEYTPYKKYLKMMGKWKR